MMVVINEGRGLNLNDHHYKYISYIMYITTRAGEYFPMPPPKVASIDLRVMPDLKFSNGKSEKFLRSNWSKYFRKMSFAVGYIFKM